MMFSTKAEYGVRVMVALARRAAASADAGSTATASTAAGGATAGEDSRGAADPRALDAVVPLAEIAEHDGLPLAYLEHLVARLRKAGLVDSRRGSRGGYMLARAAREITMAEIVEALEGSIAPIECISQNADGSIVCSREATDGHSETRHACPTKLLWTRVRFAIVRTLTETSLADLLDDVPALDVPLADAPAADVAWVDAGKHPAAGRAPVELPRADMRSGTSSATEGLTPASLPNEPLTTGA
jgi:Rrf2 family cysteine metabolism transcriptional repressor